MKRIILLSSLLLSGYSSYAQETIFTDRPNVTDAVDVIAPGTFQVEGGFLYSEEGTISSMDIPNLSFKYGLTDFLELRILTTHRVFQTQLDGIADNTTSGLTPLAFSPKISLTKQNGWVPKTALVNTFTFPNTGKAEFDVPEFQAGATALFEYTWSKLTWTNSIGTVYTYGDNGWLLTTVFGAGFTDKLGGFLELFGNIGGIGDESYNIDAGFTYLLSHNIQADVIYGHGLNIKDYYFVGCGLAWKTNFK